MNKFHNLKPMLWTDKLQETVDFYTGVLGFTVNEYNTEWGWADLSRGDAGLMLARPNEHEGFDGIKFTGSFYIHVDDADALWNELKDKTRICYEIDNFEWGMREFAIYDNNGYILQFGHEFSPGGI
jgi:catechol 2,3-dioxygenase-like lactoylglutathione lyase family enzyme